jgi:uncharacterized protein (DUF58 family)
VIHQVTPRLLLVVALTCVVLVAGVAAGLPQLVVLATPGVAVIAFGIALHRWPDIDVEVTSDTDQAVENDEICFLVTVTSRSGVPWLDLDLGLPPDFEPVAGTSRMIGRVPARSRLVFRLPVRLARWGIAAPTRLDVVARDRFGFFVSSRVLRPEVPIRIHPSQRRLAGMLVPPRLRPRLGNHTSRQRGTGSDYADVRPMVAGDPGRAINWRVSARRGERWVSDRHPERASDVLIFVDSLLAVGPAVDNTIHLAVRAALSLADSHIGSHDRVGLLDVGHKVRWIPPRLGRAHLHRIVDALLAIEVERTFGHPRVAHLPLRHLAPGTLIVVLTSLLDERPVSLVADIRARGHDVVVVECSPGSRIPPPAGLSEALARRLWRVERAALRHRLALVGVPLVRWDGVESLPARLAALNDAMAARRTGTVSDAGTSTAGTLRGVGR